MIGWVEGRLAEKTPEGVLVDVNGVGYDVRIPLSTFLELPDEGKTVRFRIHTHVREDQFQLFGFLSEEERSCFRLLLGISGVGPRLALAVLSGLPVSQLVLALREGNVTALRGIPGVGNKTAERIQNKNISFFFIWITRYSLGSTSTSKSPTFVTSLKPHSSRRYLRSRFSLPKLLIFPLSLGVI